MRPAGSPETERESHERSAGNHHCTTTTSRPQGVGNNPLRGDPSESWHPVEQEISVVDGEELGAHRTGQTAVTVTPEWATSRLTASDSHSTYAFAAA